MKNSISEIYNGLPEVVKNLFVNTDCTITEVDEIEGAPWAAGVFCFDGGMHYSAIEIVKDSPNDKATTVYHEFGHMLDYGYTECFKSQSEEFMYIFSIERNNFTVDDGLHEYYASSPAEYFAQAFAEYMIKPDRLRENTPMTYDYIEKTLYMTELEEIWCAEQIADNKEFRIILKEATEVDEIENNMIEFIKFIMRHKVFFAKAIYRGIKKTVRNCIGRLFNRYYM